MVGGKDFKIVPFYCNIFLTAKIGNATRRQDSN